MGPPIFRHTQRHQQIGQIWAGSNTELLAKPRGHQGALRCLVKGNTSSIGWGLLLHFYRQPKLDITRYKMNSFCSRLLGDIKSCWHPPMMWTIRKISKFVPLLCFFGLFPDTHGFLGLKSFCFTSSTGCAVH